MTLVYVAVGVVAVLLGVFLATKMKKSGSSNGKVCVEGSACCGGDDQTSKASASAAPVSGGACVCNSCPQDCAECEACKQV